MIKATVLSLQKEKKRRRLERRESGLKFSYFINEVALIQREKKEKNTTEFYATELLDSDCIRVVDVQNSKK